MPDTPSQVVEQLKDALESANSTVEENSSKSKQLDKDIADLSKQLAELEKVVKAYADAHEKLGKELDDLEGYRKGKWTMVKKVLLNTDEKKIEDARDDYDDAIAQLVSDIDDLRKKEAPYKAAVEDHDEKLAAFAAELPYQKKVTDTIAALNGRYKQIESEDAEDDHKAMFYLLLEFKARQQALGALDSVVALRTRLEAKWTALNGAKETLRDKEREWQVAKREIEALEEELATKRKDREKNLLVEIDEIVLSGGP